MFQLTLKMQLPLVDKEVDRGLHWRCSEFCHHDACAVLFHRRRLFAPLFPRGSVNACSFLAPILMHGDRENRVMLRDIVIYQAGEDLLEHVACLVHADALTSHLG